MQGPWSGAPNVTFTWDVALGGSDTRSCSSASSAAGLLPLAGALQNGKEEMESLYVKSAQLTAFICGTSGICWWEQTEAPPPLSRSASPGHFSCCVWHLWSGPCWIWAWVWLEGAEGGQLSAVISPCCSLSAAQALLHCKDIAARQLGRVGRESSQRCQSFLGEAESCRPAKTHNLSVILLNQKRFKGAFCNKP